MTKSPLVLGMTSAMILAGVLMWKAEATPLAGATNSLAVIKAIQRCKRRDACSARAAPLPAPNGLALNMRGQWVPTKRAFAGLASSRQRDNRIARQFTLAMTPALSLTALGSLHERGRQR